MGKHIFPQKLRAVNQEMLAFLVELGDDYDEEVHCDASQLRFLMPVGICALAAVCHNIHRRGDQKIFFDGLDPSLDSFMERMDVFKHCHVEHVDERTRRERPEALTEINKIDELADVSGVAQQLVSTITGCAMQGVQEISDVAGMQTRPSENLSFLLQYVLVELLSNSLTHARRSGYGKSSVWVAGNYYPTKKEVRFAFVDNGCGFLEALKNHAEVREEPSHIRAIEAALRPGVSSNPEVGILQDPSNQGMGLTLSTEIALVSAGGIRITSGSASVRKHYKRQYDNSYSVPWQGAMVEVTMRRDALLNADLNPILGKYRAGPVPKIQFE